MRNLENKYPNTLKELRLKNNFTQKQVATYLNLQSENRLCRWEQGQSYPSVFNLIKLCKLYEVPIENIYA
jgi:transcriptional regulator with XRE-family HTH domain